MKTIFAVLSTILFFGAGPVFTQPASSAVLGHDVIFVHGLQINHVLQRRSWVSEQDLENDSIAQAGEAAKAFIDHHFYYRSSDRLQAGIAQQMKAHVLDAVRTGKCVNGCVIVTASTGDLVTSYMLANLERWDDEEPHYAIRRDFKVLGVVDIVGAGGGTEIADKVVNIVVHKNPVSWLVRKGLELWLGTSMSGLQPAGLGALNDIRPSVARAGGWGDSGVPHLKIAGAGRGVTYQGVDITGLLIPGEDDGVVPLHSACGSRYDVSLSSCSKTTRLDGSRRSANGPNGYFYNQFPILMAKDMTHTQLNQDNSVGLVVPVDGNLSRGLNGGMRFGLKVRKDRRGPFWNRYDVYYIDYNRNQAFTKVLFESIRK